MPFARQGCTQRIRQAVDLNMNDSERFQIRYNASEQYRDHVIKSLGYKLPHVGSAEGLIELARKADAGELEAANGWRTEPPFPGAGERPEEMPTGWRMICASKLFAGDDAIGTIFMTFVSGRPVGSVVVNDFPIPREYSPIHSR
jgi:hypothetical protein